VGSIVSVPKTGGEPKVLVEGQKGLAEVALDATNLYWTTGNGKGGGTVMKVALKGGAATKLVTVKDSELGGPIGIEVDEKSVYWVVSTRFGSVQKVAKAGGAAVMLSEKQRSPYDIAGDANGVYWTNFGSGTSDGTVMALAFGKPGEKPKEPTPIATGQKTPWSIAVDGTNAYWINKGPPGSVMKAPLAGGTAVSLASDQKATLLAVDPGPNGNVYWTSEDDDTISMVPKAGGAITIIAKGQKSPSGILIDGATLYFVNTADGSLMKLAH
jgi:hypothetical protein